MKLNTNNASDFILRYAYSIKSIYVKLHVYKHSQLYYIIILSLNLY